MCSSFSITEELRTGILLIQTNFSLFHVVSLKSEVSQNKSIPSM